MPQTTLYVAAASIAVGEKWEFENRLVGPADDQFATYSASSAESATLTLTFDTADIPADAVVGNIAVRLWGSWSGIGEPSPVIVYVGNTPDLEFVLNETPGMHEVSDPAGWNMTSATVNALEGAISLTTNDAETFAFDAIEVVIEWAEPPPASDSRRRGGGALGGGALAGFGGM